MTDADDVVASASLGSGAGCDASAESRASPAADSAIDADKSARAAHAVQAALLSEWADVPFRSLSPARVARIPYPAEFAAVFGLLGAARALGEASPRSLRLAGAAIKLNPSDVSAWAYRQMVVRLLVEADGVEEGAALVAGELRFVAEMMEAAPKSYQVWEYRRIVVGLCGGLCDPDAVRDEAAFVNAALDVSEKNYHAWAHRSWLVSCADAAGVLDFDAELDDVDALITQDVRNNSAWAHRWVVYGNTVGIDAEAAAEYAERRGLEHPEMAWAIAQMWRAPRNESAWNYIFALARSDRKIAGSSVASDSSAKASDSEVHSTSATSLAVNAASLVLEGDEMNMPARRFLALMPGGTADEQVAHCRQLACEFDVERHQYWKWKAERLLQRAQRVQS
jgi:protein farnesyltransferase/geranylgeranyltransferase type-1 subunit alpha